MPSTRSNGPRLSDLRRSATKTFEPNRIFWIPHWNQFSRKIAVYDVSSHVDGKWPGSVTNDYRILVKSMHEKYCKGSQTYTYLARAQNTMRWHYSLEDARGQEVAEWKHGWHSWKDTLFTFPPNISDTSGSGRNHPVDFVRANKAVTRDRIFTVNSVMYAVEMDSTWRSNQFTIYMVIAGEKTAVCQYGQKWTGASWVGGCLAVDSEQIDEVTAILAVLATLKQNKQRVGERSSGAAGGGGGGGGP